MKGKKLFKEDILKLDGKIVYIVPKTTSFKDEGKSKISIIGNETRFDTDKGEPWITRNHYGVSDGTWLDVYEWIEEPKQYSAEEMIKLLRGSKIGESDVIYNNEKFKLSKYHFEHATIEQLIKFAPYTIEKAPKALSFNDLLDDKYNGKRIRAKHELLSGNYSDLSYLLNSISRLQNDTQVMKVIKEGKFYIKED